jgi:hypothetical protein
MESAVAYAHSARLTSNHDAPIHRNAGLDPSGSRTLERIGDIQLIALPADVNGA